MEQGDDDGGGSKVAATIPSPTKALLLFSPMVTVNWCSVTLPLNMSLDLGSNKAHDMT